MFQDREGRCHTSLAHLTNSYCQCQQLWNPACANVWSGRRPPYPPPGKRQVPETLPRRQDLNFEVMGRQRGVGGGRVKVKYIRKHPSPPSHGIRAAACSQASPVHTPCWAADLTAPGPPLDNGSEESWMYTACQEQSRLGLWDLSSLC